MQRRRTCGPAALESSRPSCFPPRRSGRAVLRRALRRYRYRSRSTCHPVFCIPTVDTSDRRPASILYQTNRPPRPCWRPSRTPVKQPQSFYSLLFPSIGPQSPVADDFCTDADARKGVASTQKTFSQFDPISRTNRQAGIIEVVTGVVQQTTALPLAIADHQVAPGALFQDKGKVLTCGERPQVVDQLLFSQPLSGDLTG